MQTELMQQLDVIASMAVAMLLGGSIGYERELKRRPAGFRTHMLVAGASALLVGVGRLSVMAQETGNGATILQVDPLRLVEAVLDYYLVAVSATALALFVLVGLSWWERRIGIALGHAPKG